MVANLDIPLSELLAAINAGIDTPVVATTNPYGAANLDVPLSEVLTAITG